MQILITINCIFIKQIFKEKLPYNFKLKCLQENKEKLVFTVKYYFGNMLEPVGNNHPQPLRGREIGTKIWMSFFNYPRCT